MKYISTLGLPWNNCFHLWTSYISTLGLPWNTELLQHIAALQCDLQKKVKVSFTTREIQSGHVHTVHSLYILTVFIHWIIKYLAKIFMHTTWTFMNKTRQKRFSFIFTISTYTQCIKLLYVYSFYLELKCAHQAQYIFKLYVLIFKLY